MISIMYIGDGFIFISTLENNNRKTSSLHPVSSLQRSRAEVSTGTSAASASSLHLEARDSICLHLQEEKVAPVDSRQAHRGSRHRSMCALVAQAEKEGCSSIPEQIRLASSRLRREHLPRGSEGAVDWQSSSVSSPV